MTKFENPSFNSPANNKKFRDNWDKIFGVEKKPPSNQETGDIKDPEKEEEELEKPETD